MRKPLGAPKLLRYGFWKRCPHPETICRLFVQSFGSTPSRPAIRAGSQETAFEAIEGNLPIKLTVDKRIFSTLMLIPIGQDFGSILLMASSSPSASPVRAVDGLDATLVLA